MAELVTLTIDGQSVSVPKGTLVWQAARQAGIDIPIYCYHPKMPPVGACRICLVQIEKMPPKPQASCTTQVGEGMIVHTQSEMAVKARSQVMELLLINHPLDCPICDKGGECDLQDFTVAFGRGSGRFQEEKRHLGKAIPLGDNVALDRERCIMCQRCVRFSNEIAMEDGLLIAERGVKAEIDTFPGKPYNSIFSGNVVEMCPVGALTARTYRFRARPWELKHSPAVCASCSVGCNLTVDVRHGRDVVRFRSRVNDAIDDGFLCDRGRYGYAVVHSPERLTSPLVRKNGTLQPASWQEAFDTIIGGLRNTPKEQIGGILSTHSTNEALYLFDTLLRQIIGTPNVDFRHGATLELGADALTGTIAGLDDAKVIVLVAADPTNRQPIIDLRIKKAIRKGAKLLIVSPAETALDRLAAHVVRTAPGQLHATLDAIVKGLAVAATPETITTTDTPAFAPQSDTIRPTGVPQDDPLATGQRQIDPRNIAGVKADEAAQAANTDPQPDSAAVTGVAVTPSPPPANGQGEQERADVAAAVKLLAGVERVSILFDDDATLTADGAHLVDDVVVLAKATNSYGVAGAGLMLLVADNNSMGAREFSQFPQQGGKSYAEMLNGGVKALIMSGSEILPTASPNFDMLVVMDTFLTPAAQAAHVVLPMATWVETEGTFTNTERRVQYTVPAVEPQKGAVPQWAILMELARRMGKPFDSRTPADVFAELAVRLPLFAGLTYEKLAAEGSEVSGADTSGQTPELLPLWKGGPNGMARVPVISRAGGD